MTITTTQAPNGTWTASTTHNGKLRAVADCPTEQDAIEKLESLISHLEKEKHERR